MEFTKEQISELMCKHAEREHGLHDIFGIEDIVPFAFGVQVVEYEAGEEAVLGILDEVAVLAWSLPESRSLGEIPEIRQSQLTNFCYAS